ncbi:MAG: hypothetical protein FWE23_04665 [Chitinivibrionia bacterium]|nr:hypothetical protein [Chitinivibrionia bacterium]
MTDEEGEYWDELFTRTTPKLSGRGVDFLSGKTLVYKDDDGTITILPPKTTSAKPQNGTMTITIDGLACKYIEARMLATKQSPAKIVSNLVKKELALA